MSMKLTVKKMQVKKDARGFLIEILRQKDLKRKMFGHLILSVAHPGQTKGGHFHKRKHEWFCVIKGKALLEVVNNRTGETASVVMGDNAMVLVKIYPHHTHTIKNVGSEDMYLLAYTDEAFHAKDEDTFRQ